MPACRTWGENAIIRLLAILAALGEKGGPWEPIALLAEKIKGLPVRNWGSPAGTRFPAPLPVT